MAEPQYKTITVTLMFGHYLVQGESALDHKWKVYMDTHTEEEEDEGASDIEPITCIRQVTFTPQNTPNINYKVSQVGGFKIQF